MDGSGGVVSRGGGMGVSVRCERKGKREVSVHFPPFNLTLFSSSTPSSHARISGLGLFVFIRSVSLFTLLLQTSQPSHPHQTHHLVNFLLSCAISTYSIFPREVT